MITRRLATGSDPQNKEKFHNKLSPWSSQVDEKEPGVMMSPTSELLKKRHPSVQAGDENQRGQNDPGKFQSTADLYGKRCWCKRVMIC
ncbi:uncharacterized [Tachysurus ichikawai]